jgi:D-glycero-alpha-D-manno-heptose-7-phosphate kinase
VIITRTPYRVSFFGGGTDYPEWYKDNGGSVLSTCIPHYCYLSGRVLPPFFNHRHRIVWSQVEKPNHIDEIQHPAVREALKWLKINSGMEINHHGDLPARSGLGSSSSFAVGLLNMLYNLQGKEVTKKGLAEAAIHLESNLLKENVGIQDQIITTYGGLNRTDINKDGSYEVMPIQLNSSRQKEFESRILLFYTGVSRTASDIAKEKIKSIPHKTRELSLIQSLVEEAVNIITSDKDLDEFGKLLDETWSLKKSLTEKVSPTYVDDIYNKAIKAGALGGKLLGAGGGGFVIFYVPEGKKDDVMKALDNLLLVPFGIENDGSKVLFKESSSYSQTSSLEAKKFFKANLD